MRFDPHQTHSNPFRLPRAPPLEAVPKERSCLRCKKPFECRPTSPTPPDRRDADTIQHKKIEEQPLGVLSHASHATTTDCDVRVAQERYIIHETLGPGPIHDNRHLRHRLAGCARIDCSLCVVADFFSFVTFVASHRATRRSSC